MCTRWQGQMGPFNTASGVETGPVVQLDRAVAAVPPQGTEDIIIVGFRGRGRIWGTIVQSQSDFWSHDSPTSIRRWNKHSDQGFQPKHVVVIANTGYLLSIPQRLATPPQGERYNRRVTWLCSWGYTIGLISRSSNKVTSAFLPIWFP